MTQYFYVDESGDPGLDRFKNSPYYIVAMVQVSDREPIAELAKLDKSYDLPLVLSFIFTKRMPDRKHSFFKLFNPFCSEYALLF
jgi:hypothetical protein